MTPPAPVRMAQRLTTPFARGGDTLVLSLSTTSATAATVAAYDFREHRAKFDRAPEPRYVLIAQVDVPTVTVVTVAYEVRDSSGTTTAATVTRTFEKGTLAGSGFLLDLGPHESADTRITGLVVSPPAVSGRPDAEWSLVALLGNLSKLLWVTGAELDTLRRQLEIVQSQRRLASATGASLDLLGFDLGVPRFPPLPHSFDQDTIALYHLDVAPGAAPAVEDLAARYTAVNHHGTVSGGLATAGVVGRLDRGFGFRDPGAEILIPDHADFNLPASLSMTVEGFVKPDADSGEGEVLSKHADPANPAVKGWALGVGDFGRGVPSNVRLLLSDGAVQVTLFADVTLDATRFTHLAGSINRTAQEAQLYVNGVLRAAASTAALGALTNASQVRIGRAGSTAFRGVIDEVRLSRAARTVFASVLGESDDSYRRRLRIFERWTLPAPAELQRILNEAAGPIAGEKDPLIVLDANATIVGASRFLRVVPTELNAGERIDAFGRRRVKEAAASGTLEEDELFDPASLIVHNDARATYAPPPARALKPGQPPPDARRMHRVAGRLLTALLDLLAAQGISGVLHVEEAFDPRASDLRAVGRGLLLRHATLAPGRLAALAHQVGFSFVARPPLVSSVYASTAQADALEVEIVAGGTATGADGVDLRVGETLNLSVRPTLPADTLYDWKTISCGEGRAVFTSRTDRPSVTILATRPGSFTVKVDASRRHRVLSATRVLRAGLVALDDNQSISRDGRLGVAEAVAGSDDTFFHDAYLVTHDHPRVVYGALNTRRLHPAAARRLDRLMELTALLAAVGRVEIVQAMEPGAPGLRGLGRALIVRPVNAVALPIGRLGALAHAAGFTFVRRQGAQVLLRQADEDLMTVDAQPDTREIDEHAAVALSCRPRARPRALALTASSAFFANSGTDTITEVARATQRVRRAIKVGWAPVDVVVSPDGSTAYTADSRSDTVTVVTLATGAVRSVQAPAGPSALAHHPTLSRLYVAAFAANTIAQFDTRTMGAPTTVVVPAGPGAIAMTPATGELWVISRTARRITVLTANTLAVLATIVLPDEPHDLVIAPDGARAYVTIPAAGFIRVVDVAARTLLRQFSVGGVPTSIASAPDGGRLYVADTDAGRERLRVLETQAAAPFLVDRGGVRIRKAPAAVAAGSNVVHVAHEDSDLVSVLDLVAVPVHVSQSWRLGSGLGEQLAWVLRAEGEANARFSNTAESEVRLLAEQSGSLLVRAVYSLPEKLAPYTFEVRLTPALEAAGAVITKAQYDLIMNVLNAFHPIGVEVITRAIGERVIEVRDALQSAFPDYTYPNFRVRGHPRVRRAR